MHLSDKEKLFHYLAPSPRQSVEAAIDADLILPKQELSIDLKPSASEIKKAIQHAHHRGTWHLGEIEASDISYLRR